jgi:hypothetical protein
MAHSYYGRKKWTQQLLDDSWINAKYIDTT